MDFVTLAKDYGFDLDGKIFKAFAEYLYGENQKMDLTAAKTLDEIYIKHILDSLSPLKVYDIKKDAKVIDIGCGAGFPGIPMRLARPDIKLTCLDSLNKRIDFIADFARKNNLENIEPISARAEELAFDKDYRESYDVAVSRAVAPLNKLIELALPYVKTGGVFISLKGMKAKEEADEAQNAINILGGRLSAIENCGFKDDMSGHSAVIIEKVSPTPENYPRRFSKISKKPL